MYTLYVIILLVLFILNVKIFFRHKTINPLFTLFLGISYFILYPYIIIVLNNGYTSPQYFGILGDWGDIDIEIMSSYPFLFVFVFLTIFYLMNIFLRKKIKLVDKIVSYKLFRIHLNTHKKLVYNLIFMSIIIVLFFIIEAGGIENYLAKGFHFRQDELAKESELLYLFIQYLNKALQVLIISISTLYINSLYLKNIRDKKFITIVFVYQIAQMIFSGNRILIVIFLLFIISLMFMYKDKKNLFKVLFILPIMIGILLVWSMLRSNIFDSLDRLDSFFQTIDINPIATTLLGLAEGMNVVVLLHIIEDFGKHYDYLYGLNYIKLFIFYIPRSIFPDKPINFTTLIAQLYEPSAIGFSLNSTFLGEMYANLGFLTLFLLPSLVIIILILSTKIAKSNLTILYITSFSIFWMTRVTFAETVIFFLITFILFKIFKNFRLSLFIKDN